MKNSFLFGHFRQWQKRHIFFLLLGVIMGFYFLTSLISFDFFERFSGVNKVIRIISIFFGLFYIGLDFIFESILNLTKKIIFGKTNVDVINSNPIENLATDIVVYYLGGFIGSTLWVAVASTLAILGLMGWGLFELVKLIISLF